MRKFKVISLAVSGKHNKIFRTHDEVTERQVHDADELVERGHLKEIEQQAEAVAPVETAPIPPPPADPNAGKESEAGSGKDESNVSRETTETTNGGITETESTPPPPPPAEEESSHTDKTGIDAIDIADIKKELKARGVKFQYNASKEELYRLYIL